MVIQVLFIAFFMMIIKFRMKNVLQIVFFLMACEFHCIVMIFLLLLKVIIVSLLTVYENNVYK